MDEARKKVEELVALVRERGRGALICFYDPGEDGKNITLRSEGYERNLSMMIGAAVLEDKEMKKNKNKNKTKYAEA